MLNVNLGTKGTRRVEVKVDGNTVLTLEDSMKCPLSGEYTWRISHMNEIPQNIKDASRMIREMDAAFIKIKNLG